MKILLAIPILFCLQDSVKVDTTRIDTSKLVKQKMFFDDIDIEQQTEKLNTKLDSLIVKLQAKKDSANLK